MISATLLGRLGRDPESRSTSGGSTVCSFNVACDHGFGDRRKTTWVRVVVFGKTATWAQSTIKKGDQVVASGSLYEDTWTDRENQERKTLTLDANEVKNVSPRPAQAGTREQPSDGGGL